MKITVSRLPADKQGNDVVDVLLVSDAVGRARGQREVDDSASKVVEQGNAILKAYMETGEPAEITLMGEEPLRGKVTGFYITIDIDGSRFTPQSSITNKRLL